MPYTYTPNTPNSSDPMNVTQPLILENFQAIQELIAINHVGFNVPGIGYHNQVQMPNTVAPSTPEPSGITMFTKATGSPNPSEIFGQYPSGNIFQISGAPVVNSGTGFIQFSSGIIFKWGTATSPSGATQYVFVYPSGSGIPAFTVGVPFVQVTYNTTGANVASPNLAVVYSQVNQFQYNNYLNNVPSTQFPMPSVNWFAIGF